MKIKSPRLEAIGLRLREHEDGISGKRLNLASGNDYREGWTNLDLYAPKADVRHDLERFPYPFLDDQFDFIYADQILEHLPDRLEGQDGLIRVLQEIHRILKPNGTLYVGVPDGRSPRWHGRNMTHRRMFYPETLQTLDPDNPCYDSTVHYQAGITFSVRKVIVLRRFTFTRFFDTMYHLPKYLGIRINIGKPWGLVFLLEKT